MKSKSFLYLMGAQAISNLGDWLDLLALFSLVVFRWQASSIELTVGVLCLAIPTVLFGPIAGVYADRMERRTLMIAADLVRAVLVLSLIFVTQLWQVYLVLFCKGVFEALFTPAKNGKLKEIVPREHLQQATTISTIIDQLAKIIGPIAGGTLVGLMGITAAFYLDALSFLLSALLLLGVPRQGQRHSPQLKQRDASFMLEIKEGLRFVRSIPFLLYGMICFSLVMLGIQLVDSQIMILLRELKHVSTSFIGVTMGASGIGLLCIAVLLGKRRLTTPFQLMAAGAVGMGVAYACVGLSVSNEGVAWWLIPVLFLGGGASVGMVFIPFQTQAQRSTPVELSGRVFGTVNSVVTAAVIIGPILGAVLVTGFGVITAFVIAGCSLILMGAAAFLLRNRVERSERIVAKSDGAAQGTTQA